MSCVYHEEFDILSIRLGDMSNSYGDEDSNGIVTHRDMDTEEITGYTVFDYLKG